MRPDLYNERSTRLHIKRFKEILYTPGILNLSHDISDSLNAFVSPNKEENEATTNSEVDLSTKNDTSEAKTEDTKTETSKTDEVEKEEPKSDSKQNEDSKLQNIEELKKIEQDYQTMVKAYKDAWQDTKNSIPRLNIESQTIDLEKIYLNVLDNEMDHFEPIKCIESINFSSFNPPPPSCQMKGDLLYIKIKTLEGGEHVITCNSRGFYINNSVGDTVFDPIPTQRINPCYSHSLVGLLHQLSDRFSKKIEEHVNKIVSADPFWISNINNPISDWASPSYLDHAESNYFKINNEEAISGYYGLESKGTRDWNEEIQVCKDLPKQSILQRIQRDRAFYKIYYDFLEAAKKGSIAIINKSIPPLNPMDEDHQHVFVYNQIFFSFAIDSAEKYKDVSSSDSNPSYTATNHDMLGLKTLHAIDIDGMHIIATCHVNYKGHRVIAQSIIPGILTNTDQSSLTEFGSVDDGKTINSNPEFCEIMKKLSEHLAIKDSKILDEENKIHEIPGSVDVKGIRGTDKRKYLLDLVRLTPRDLNFKGPNYSSCLVRPELIRIYQKTKDLEFATNKVNEMFKENPEEDKTTDSKNESEKPQDTAANREKTNNDNPDKTQETDNKEIEERKQKQIERIKEFNKALREGPQYKYNLNLYTNAKLVEEDYKEDQKQIKDLSQFIIDTQIPKIVKLFKGSENVPTDNESLWELLHSNGINIRYLGKIYDQIDSEYLPHIKSLIERSIIWRSAKKVINEMLRKCPQTQVSTFLAHVLNLILSPNSLIEKLNNSEIKCSPFNILATIDRPTTGGNEGNQKKKQNKNKKKNKNKNAIENGTTNNDKNEVSIYV